MQTFKEALDKQFGEGKFLLQKFRDNNRVIVPAEHLLEVMGVLKSVCGFDMLSDVTAVDYLNYPGAVDRYHVVYVLTNTGTAERLIVKVPVNDPDPAVPSLTGMWIGADWIERECYDMFGIVFENHPDLRRILMPEGFASYPLRKDYPLRGRGERHNFETVLRSDS